jgi:hypothetical protein
VPAATLSRVVTQGLLLSADLRAESRFDNLSGRGDNAPAPAQGLPGTRDFGGFNHAPRGGRHAAVPSRDADGGRRGRGNSGGAGSNAPSSSAFGNSSHPRRDSGGGGGFEQRSPSLQQGWSRPMASPGRPSGGRGGGEGYPAVAVAWGGVVSPPASRLPCPLQRHPPCRSQGPPRLLGPQRAAPPFGTSPCSQPQATQATRRRRQW